MNFIYASISALVICSSNKIVLVCRAKLGCAEAVQELSLCQNVHQVKGGSPAGEDSDDYGTESSKTVGTVQVYYGSSSSSSFLSSYCSEPCNSCWIFPLRMISLPFESMWSLSSADTGTGSWGRRQLFRDSGTKVENLSEETKWWDFHPVEELVKEEWKLQILSPAMDKAPVIRDPDLSAQAVVAQGINCRY